MPARNLIFDFDGTLADTFPIVVEVSYRIAPKTRRLAKKEIERLRQFALMKAVLRLGIPRWHIPFLIAFTRSRLTPMMKDVPIYPGVKEMLLDMRRSGHKLYILTSNYRQNVMIFLQHHDLEDLFEEVSTVRFANVYLKTRALKKLAKANNLVPQDCYYIGNESLDIRAARNAGMKGVAITWSEFNLESLKRAKPHAVIDRPKDLIPIIEAT